MVSGNKPPNGQKRSSADSCCDHAKYVETRNRVSETSTLNKSDLSQSCDHNPCVPPTPLSSSDHFREANCLSSFPYRTQLVGRGAPDHPGQDFHF